MTKFILHAIFFLIMAFLGLGVGALREHLDAVPAKPRMGVQPPTAAIYEMCLPTLDMRDRGGITRSPPTNVMRREMLYADIEKIMNDFGVSHEVAVQIALRR